VKFFNESKRLWRSGMGKILTRAAVEQASCSPTAPIWNG
jgi:hypothetical protein